MSLPPLKNDCFALPPGVVWTPVDDALVHLRDGLSVVVGDERIALDAALGRIVAEDILARRANPPTPNAAVDGYGFAYQDGVTAWPLAPGRAAAGVPLGRAVPAGQAVRILTGAPLPEGVDTVILQEDVEITHDVVRCNGHLKRGSNTRCAGEDKQVGDLVLPAGHVIRAPDLAALAATGHGQVKVRKRLRVGVLSTGDELAAPGSDPAPAAVFDANGPMLRALIAGWGMEVVDLGRAPDDRDAVRAVLEDAAQRCDAVLTSGGASGGDEDHMSALLQAEGTQVLWRIAIKPGRPLALGLWDGVPIFGLPGNPVAAGVTAMLFARPALGVLAGAGWRPAPSVNVPATFAKTKKAGRREYLRARLGPDGVERFESEGSGRVSGLSWAEGLVELPDEAMEVRPGDLVRYLPYGGLLTL